jgi:hypothetical protein
MEQAMHKSRPRARLAALVVMSTLFESLATSPIARSDDILSLLDLGTLPDLAPVVLDSGSWYKMPHNEATDPQGRSVVDPSSDTWIGDLQTCSGCNNYLLLDGFADPDGNGIPQGTPYYRAPPASGDHRLEVDCFRGCNYPRNPIVPQVCTTPGVLKCFHLAVKPGWTPGDSTDSAIVMFDRTVYADGDGNYAVHMHGYCPPLPFTNTHCLSTRPNGTKYTADGVFVTYLTSNGLDGCWPKHYSHSVAASRIADAPNEHNNPHFGVPAPYRAIRYNEVVIAGSASPVASIPHMLKITLPSSITNNSNYFPATGDHGSSGNPISEGIVMRIKPSITLTASMLGNNNYALAIAETLQTHGAIVGETGGNVATVGGVENLAAEGSAHSWADLNITNAALKKLPLLDYEFLYRGYGGPSLTEWIRQGQQCENQPYR